MGWMGSRKTLPRNAIFGIRTSSTTTSDDAWKAAHRAAAPYSYGSATVFLAGGIASAVLGTTENERGVLLIAGVALGMIVLAFGVRKANQAADANN